MLRFLLLALIFISFLCQTTIFSNENSDKSTIYNYTAKTFFRIPSLHTTIEDKDKTYSLDYTPNVELQAGIGGSLYDFGASLSFNIPMGEEQRNKYGKTEYFDFQLYYTNEHFGMDFYLQVYQGFYLEDKDKITIRDDIALVKIGVNSFYIFNENFSLKAGIDQSKKQKNSESSWFILSGLELFALYSPNNLIPLEYSNNNEMQYLGGRYFTLSIAPGYGYITSNDGWFFTGIFFLGLGVQYRNNFFKEEIKEYGISLKLNMRLSSGYNGKRFYTGIFFVGDINNAFLDKIDVGANSINVELFWAYRF
jgi:hypothetical protein